MGENGQNDNTKYNENAETGSSSVKNQQQQQQTQSQQQRQQTTTNRFADYFVICGLDQDTGLEPDRFAGDSLHCPPLDRAYKSKPLAHYPEHVSWNPFDSHGICMLSLPQGLRFRTQKHSIEPHFHSFATTREDGKRCHGFSLIFYEEIRNQDICDAMHTLQSMFMTELSNGQSSPGLQRVKDSPISRSLPRHFKLAANTPASAVSYYKINKDKLYVAKSISLVCQVAYAHVAEIFLTNLYKCLPRQPGPSLSLESYVYNILYEVIIPEPGRSIRIYLPPDEPHLPPIPTILQRPGLSDELPLMDFPIRLLFTYIGVECVIQLFTCVLLESQVLLRSSDYQKLMIVGECITALLFPFVWPHVYAPILPVALHHFLDAPVPFVMGLHADSESYLKIGNEATLCCVDIDKKTIQLPEELPLFPHRSDFIAEISAILDKFNVNYRDKSVRDVVQSMSSQSTTNSSIASNIFSSRRNDDVMTSSCTLPSGMHARRKLSLHDTFDWDRPSSPNALDGQTQPLLAPASDRITQKPPLNNAALPPRIGDIVRRSGVTMDEIDCSNDVMPAKRRGPLSQHERYCEDLRLNNSVREIFLNRFVQMFATYEHFVIWPNQDKNEWLTNRESLQNFDKASFLSDQQQHHRPFLSRFLESQMFATLIDNKIMAMWDSDIDSNLKLFDSRIKILKKRHGGENMIRSANYEPCILARETQRFLDKRLNNVDMEVSAPSEILPNRPAYFRSFPTLEKSVLSQESASRGNSLRRFKNGSKWRTREISIDGKPPTFSSSSAAAAAANRNSANLATTELSPALLAQANWTFVEKLLKDCKSKTKRMLLEKMGTEAIALGLSGEVSVIGVEENTMIASLCDLLEKVWSHGLTNKQGKSALWSHLQSYLDSHDDSSHPPKDIDTTFLTPDLSSLAIENESPRSPTRGRSKSRDRKDSTPDQLRTLPESLEFDIKNILAMTDIKTHIGYARAWVRLALEKKLLSKHFRTLLSDTALLRNLYKRNAFVRCEEEKEQFLYHLLTLNAVDYFCFTNTYPTTKLPYRVVIFPSKKYGPVTTTANVWVAISGTLCETQQVTIPRSSLEFVFHHKNLGILTTLRIGHDNSGPSPKWMVEHILVRNEVTGHTYKFACGRWLGRGVDDGSTERLLVGQLVPRTVDSEELVEVCRTPPRSVSPSVHRPEIRPSDIQHMLGDCVNAIVKWHYRPNRERDTSSLTNLLCGEDGLVKCMESAFLYGFKSQRLFGRNFYIWDFLVKVKEQFELNLVEEALSTENSSPESPHSPAPAQMTPAVRQELTAIWRCYNHLMDEINNVTQSLGKDGKFQLFICLSLREHLLYRMLQPIAATQVTQEMYEDQSFMRRKGLLTFLRQILEPLDEFHIVLENSLTQGIASQC
ncbi:DENN domain-containing protein 5B isoform X2 [Contarinia nasturtii]|uniref:DENN domain-containing protein 5B isoform X2 n=1 Tax=Contarinia nasturtii TaxID=265458 RepID=UPI0012D497ED|nr:DENN domain-containing protein 5B isoform X2 [Contarinia nasturtii]